MKELTEKEVWNKVTAYCSIAERCSADVVDKLQKWGVERDVLSNITSKLVEEKYIDEKRYSFAFVNDKYRFAKWGKVKIVQALKQKQVPEDVYDLALKDVDENEYLDILRNLLNAKRKTIHAKNEYEQNGKLIRFALSRGFEMKDIRHCIHLFDDNDFDY
jgi:regulatory protein